MPGLKKATRRQLKEKIQTTTDELFQTIITPLADKLPENNYWAFSFFTVILPVILEEISHYTIPNIETTGLVWNYVDGACSFVTGTNQLLDNQTHRPIATKIKGAINIGSSIQLIAISALNLSLFSGPSFIAAFGISLLISLDDVARTFARKYSFKYWLKDNLAQLQKIDALQTKLEASLSTLGETKDNSSTMQWAYRRKEKRLKDLKKKKETLEEDVLFRIHTHCRTHTHIIHNELRACGPAFQNTTFMKQVTDIADGESLAYHRSSSVSERTIQKKCDEDIVKALTESIAWSIAFAGVLLMCLPGCQLAGLILVAASSAIYLARNTKTLHSVIKTGAHHFFNSSKKKGPKAPPSSDELTPSSI